MKTIPAFPAPELRQKATGIRSIQVVAQVLRQAFDTAIRRGKYHGQTPFKVEPTPKHEYKELRALTADESKAFVKAARQDTYEALWLLYLFAGLRQGEGLGLQWSDVDFGTGEVIIQRQLTEPKGKPKITERLKTKRSKSSVYVSALVLEALRRRQRKAEQEGHGSPYCFTSASGSFVYRRNLRRHFDKICMAAGIKDFAIHGLRHTMASHTINQGFTVVEAAERMRDSVTTTLARYGHVVSARQSQLAQNLEKALAA